MLIALEEKGAGYRVNPVTPETRRAEPHISRHPFGRVPVLEHGDFMLYETQAILRYVDEAFPGPELQPANVRAAARMNQILGIIDCYLFKSWSAEIGLERLVAPNFFGRPSNLQVIEAAVPMARCCAEALEGLISVPYLTGETFSLADIRLMPHFDWLRRTPEGETILAGKSKLAQWFRRVSERPSARILQQ